MKAARTATEYERDALVAEKEALVAEKEALKEVVKAKDKIIDFNSKLVADKDRVIEEQGVHLNKIQAELDMKDALLQNRRSSGKKSSSPIRFIPGATIKQTAASLNMATSAQKRRYQAN